MTAFENRPGLAPDQGSAKPVSQPLEEHWRPTERERGESFNGQVNQCRAKDDLRDIYKRMEGPDDLAPRASGPRPGRRCHFH